MVGSLQPLILRVFFRGSGLVPPPFGKALSFCTRILAFVYAYFIETRSDLA